MLERRARWIACLGILAAVSVAGARPLGPEDVPPRFISGGVDRHLVKLQSPVLAGTWAAWSYRNSGEYDIALAWKDEAGRWAGPFLLGEGNRLDDVEPALAVDETGNLYLVTAVQTRGVIELRVRPAGSQSWTAPIRVSAPTERASAPTILVLSDRLVIGYRVGAKIVLVQLERASGTSPNGVQDGPDGFPPTEGNDDEDDNGGAGFNK